MNLRQLFELVGLLVDDDETPRRINAKIVIDVCPGGVCDGSKKYYYDRNAEDGRGAKMPKPCSGCRACS